MLRVTLKVSTITTSLRYTCSTRRRLIRAPEEDRARHVASEEACMLQFLSCPRLGVGATGSVRRVSSTSMVTPDAWWAVAGCALMVPLM